MEEQKKKLMKFVKLNETKSTDEQLPASGDCSNYQFAPPLPLSQVRTTNNIRANLLGLQ